MSNMSKILVTGASGHIGRLTLEKLLDRRPASELIGLVRDPAKAQNLAALGIELRQGDYLEKASLLKAFEGVDKVLLLKDGALEMFGPRAEVLKRLMNPPRPAELPTGAAPLARLEGSAAR